MNKSEQINDLILALSKAQGEFDSVDKTKDGYGYKYAELGACIEACKPVLAKNQLSVIQTLGTNEQGQSVLTTMLAHSSGQWLSDTALLVEAVLSGNAGKNPVQCLGASITYMRRYAYASILGLAQVDTDAADMVKPKQPKQQPKQQGKQQPELPWFNEDDFVRCEAIFADMKSQGATGDQIVAEVRKQYAVSRVMADDIKAFVEGC